MMKLNIWMFRNIWEIKYPLSDGSDYLVIATTRPETMLGDTELY